jgi:hypothetical protein
MKTGFIEIPNFPVDIYNTLEKPGSRTEYSLKLSDELNRIAQSISDVPLRYASLVLARPGNESQDFHSDSNTGERAIIYLTDVLEDSNGPIEFEHGKVLGPSGTYVKYSASEIHRGCSSDIDRLALALAFDSSSKIITTIGGSPTGCAIYVCPSGYRLKDPPPAGTASTELCCEKSDTLKNIVVALLVLFLAWFYILR